MKHVFMVMERVEYTKEYSKESDDVVHYISDNEECARQCLEYLDEHYLDDLDRGELNGVVRTQEHEHSVTYLIPRLNVRTVIHIEVMPVVSHFDRRNRKLE